MSNFKIEKNIPMVSKDQAYPFKEMEVNDSFSFGSEITQNVRSALNYFLKGNTKMKFSIKKVSEDSHRCWRIL